MLIIPLVFASESAKSILSNNSKIRPYFDKETPRVHRVRASVSVCMQLYNEWMNGCKVNNYSPLVTDTKVNSYISIY